MTISDSHITFSLAKKVDSDNDLIIRLTWMKGHDIYVKVTLPFETEQGRISSRWHWFYERDDQSYTKRYWGVPGDGQENMGVLDAMVYGDDKIDVYLKSFRF